MAYKGNQGLGAAIEKLKELDYDPISALVEIARNRNQLADIRVKAAIALLPYAYAQVPAKLDVNFTDNTGVLRAPAEASEEAWERQAAGFGGGGAVEDADIIALRKPH